MAEPTGAPADLAPLPAGAWPVEPPQVLAVSPDGAAVAVISGRELYLLDGSSGAVRWALTSPGHKFDLWFSRDGARLILLGYGEVHAFDAATGAWVRGVAERYVTQAVRLAASADGGLLLAHLQDRLLLLDADTLLERARWGCATDTSDWRMRYHDADLHPSGAWVAWVIGDYGQTSGVVVRVGEDAPVATFDGAERVRFTAEGDRVVVARGSDGAEVLPWPPDAGGRPFAWPSFERARFWPGGALLLRGGETTVLEPGGPEERWSAANYEPPADAAVHAEAGVYFTAHATWIGRRRLADGGLLDVFPIRRGTLPSAAVLPSGPGDDLLVVGDRDGRVAVWDLAALRRITLADAGPNPVDGAGVARGSLGWVRGLRVEGDQLWVVCDKGVFAWTGWGDLDRPPDVAVEGAGSPWSCTGRRVVGQDNGDVVVTAVPEGAVVARMPRPDSWGWREPVASPDAGVLYAGEADGDRSVVSAWDPATGEEIAVLEVDGFAEVLLADEVGVWLGVVSVQEAGGDGAGDRAGEDEDDEDDEEGRFVVRWNPRSGAIVELLPARRDGVVVAPRLDERRAVFSTWSDGLRVVDRATGAVVLALGRDGGQEVLAWDGQRLVTGDGRGRVQVWSVSDGRRLAELGSGPFGSWWAVDAAGQVRWEPGPMAWGGAQARGER